MTDTCFYYYYISSTLRHQALDLEVGDPWVGAWVPETELGFRP